MPRSTRCWLKAASAGAAQRSWSRSCWKDLSCPSSGSPTAKTSSRLRRPEISSGRSTVTRDGIRTLEFNARFGDPEAQVVLPRLQTDFVALTLAAAKGTLANFPDLRWNPQACVGVVVASGGYPDDAAVKTGFQIRGLAEMPPGVLLFHAATRFVPGRGLVTAGGRVATSAALGDTVREAREKALAGARQVRFQGAFYRTDIAKEADEG